MVFKYVQMLSRTSCINHLLHTVCSYYEGQLTPISENDVEDKEHTPQVRVTEAAEKVCFTSIQLVKRAFHNFEIILCKGNAL